MERFYIWGARRTDKAPHLIMAKNSVTSGERKHRDNAQVNINSRSKMPKKAWNILSNNSTSYNNSSVLGHRQVMDTSSFVTELVVYTAQTTNRCKRMMLPYMIQEILLQKTNALSGTSADKSKPKCGEKSTSGVTQDSGFTKISINSINSCDTEPAADTTTSNL